MCVVGGGSGGRGGWVGARHFGSIFLSGNSVTDPYTLCHPFSLPLYSTAMSQSAKCHAPPSSPVFFGIHHELTTTIRCDKVS